jgi:hypothetical protein
MPITRHLIRPHPRLSPALAFGGVAALVTHFAWAADVRLSGGVPALSIGCGLAHAIAGAGLGPSVIGADRTATRSKSLLRGAQVSLLAQVLFDIPFSIWLGAANTAHSGILSRIGFTALVAFFAFLAAGWALCVVSAAVGLALFWLAHRGESPEASAGEER